MKPRSVSAPVSLELAQACFEPRRYDCLGCETCWPAVAGNAAAEIDPSLAEASHCATAEPEPRAGWPPTTACCALRRRWPFAP